MIRKDIPTVADIEIASFQYPWSQNDLVEYLRQSRSIGKVVEVDDRIAGYVVYDMLPRAISIATLAVAPQFRRRGVGRAMIRSLLNYVNAQQSFSQSTGKRDRITALVRETSLESQLFLKAVGFRAVSVIKSPYEQTDEDGYWFELRSRVNSKA